MSDLVNHPPHYNAIPAKCECGKGIECIQITEHMDFLTGNAMKYLYRHEHKGSPIQDLEKAAWYIQRKIEKLRAKELEGAPEGLEDLVDRLRAEATKNFWQHAERNMRDSVEQKH